MLRIKPFAMDLQRNYHNGLRDENLLSESFSCSTLYDFLRVMRTLTEHVQPWQTQILIVCTPRAEYMSKSFWKIIFYFKADFAVTLNGLFHFSTFHLSAYKPINFSCPEQVTCI